MAERNLRSCLGGMGRSLSVVDDLDLRPKPAVPEQWGQDDAGAVFRCDIQMNQYPGQEIAQAVVENLLDIVLGAIEPQERGFEQM
jgi:hypothetical protein